MPSLENWGGGLKTYIQYKQCMFWGYNSLKLWAQPVEKLIETCAILPSAGTLSDQRRVSREDHTLSDTAITFPTDFTIVKLLKNIFM